MENMGAITVQAGEALAAKRRVKIDASASATAGFPVVVYADAGEDFIGITEYSCASGDKLSIAPMTIPGMREVSVNINSAIAIGTVLYGANDGQMSDASSGSAQGIAMKAAAADHEHIPVMVWSVKSTTAATVSVADTGGFTLAATVEAALAEIYQHLLSAQKTIPVPLGAITYEDGTAFTKQATTVAGYAQIGDKELVINIPVNCTAGEAMGFNVPVPQDLDDSADITVHVLVSKAADNDALTLDCEVYPCAAGDLQNADIQDTAAQAIVAAGTELVFTCGADGVLAAPGTLTVVLTLGGTNDGDATYIHGAWIEYTAKALTA